MSVTVSRPVMTGNIGLGPHHFNPALSPGKSFGIIKPYMDPEGKSALKVCLLIVVLAAAAFAGLYEDLLARGVPVRTVTTEEDNLLVEIEGSLSRGDSLLKHYGGTFFLLLDSIAGGWPLMSLEVRISGASLILFREDVFEALSLMGRGAEEKPLLPGFSNIPGSCIPTSNGPRLRLSPSVSPEPSSSRA
ncbi:MAG: hypothetical protein MZU95_05830 [Desulfomicrobium escambiense]|nr:hypothetical protein [Desulfomicrobium escambiense]